MLRLDPQVERAVELELQRHGPFTEADVAGLEKLAVMVPRDFGPLSMFPSLRVLILVGYPGRDLSMLAGHKALSSLTVRFCAVVDVDALMTVPTLRWVELPANAIEDISALRPGLPRLRQVDLSGNPLSEDSYRKVVPELRERVSEGVTVSGEREWLITRRLYAAGVPFDYYVEDGVHWLCRPGLEFTDAPDADHAEISPDELEAILDRDPAQVRELFPTY